MAVGQGRGKPEVLFDHDDGQALGLERADHAAQRLHDHGGKTFGDLVEQQDARARTQDARHRQHLLLTA